MPEEMKQCHLTKGPSILDKALGFTAFSNPRRHGVGPVHSREVPLPLTRDELGLWCGDYASAGCLTESRIKFCSITSPAGRGETRINNWCYFCFILVVFATRTLGVKVFDRLPCNG